MIKKLYEGNASGKIPDKHFARMLAEYDTEQSVLEADIARMQAEVDTFNTVTVNIDKFVELVKRHTEFAEFSPGLLNEFVEKVIVHEAVKVDDVRTQDVEIFFTFIGKFELDGIGTVQTTKTPVATKKLRRDMTEEEVAREREYDRRRYAKKRDARIAAEQAQRAAILQGTPYAIQSNETGVVQIAV